MTIKRIIPCLDIKNGRVVKGVQFAGLRDAGDPVELATFYDKEGADELVLLNISATDEGRKMMADIVRNVAAKIRIPIVVGGGISTIEDMKAVLRAGADKVSVNTAALLNPDLLNAASNCFGSHSLVLAIDAKWDHKLGSWRVYTHGGRTPTDKEVLAWARLAVEQGAGEILLTSIDKDGEKSGYDIELMKAVSAAVRVPIIASGGAGKLDDFYQLFTETKADAALAASVFHYQETAVQAVKKELQRRGVAVNVEGKI